MGCLRLRDSLFMYSTVLTYLCNHMLSRWFAPPSLSLEIKTLTRSLLDLRSHQNVSSSLIRPRRVVQDSKTHAYTNEHDEFVIGLFPLVIWRLILWCWCCVGNSFLYKRAIWDCFNRSPIPKLGYISVFPVMLTSFQEVQIHWRKYNRTCKPIG